MKQWKLILIAALTSVFCVFVWMAVPNSVWADNNRTASVLLKGAASLGGAVSLYLWYRIFKSQGV